MRINTPLNGEAKLQGLRHLILGLILSEQRYNDQGWEKILNLFFITGFILRTNNKQPLQLYVFSPDSKKLAQHQTRKKLISAQLFASFLITQTNQQRYK